MKECRGAGLAAAVEFYNEAVCRSVCARLKEAGFLTGQFESSLYVKPPYVITKKHVEDFLAAMEKALREVKRG